MTDETDEGKVRCPYCNSVDGCPHLLLLVDLTFRTANGGVLCEAFSGRWSHIFEEEGEAADFDEHERFEDLLAVVEGLADWDGEVEFEGGPGMSSTYRHFFASTPNRAQAALARFGRE